MNPLDFDSNDTVVALDAGPDTVASLRAAYPDRRVFIIERVPGQPRLQLRDTTQ
jgi:hypothetical protein